MRVSWLFVVAAIPSVFLGSTAHGAEVAVMPVEGVNLNGGELDAIGVMFANAFARDARVAVASPFATKPLQAGNKTPSMISRELGASRYVELRAIRVGNRVTLRGELHRQDGALTWHAETTAWTLEAVDTAVAQLSQSLAWSRPISPTSNAVPGSAAQATTYEAPPIVEADDEEEDRDVSKSSNGIKFGVAVPRASGRTFSPSIVVQFDGRLGPRSYFLEYGAGLMIPSDEHYVGDSVDLQGGFIELGGSFYLWDANVALYLGGGLSPAIWAAKSGYQDHVSVTCGGYGQAGITFTRNSRAKFYAEFRMTQLLLPVAAPVEDSYGTFTTSDSYYPTLLSFQGGVGW